MIDKCSRRDFVASAAMAGLVAAGGSRAADSGQELNRSDPQFMYPSTATTRLLECQGMEAGGHGCGRNSNLGLSANDRLHSLQAYTFGGKSPSIVTMLSL